MVFLNLKIRRMKDGRFYVRYYWNIFGLVHREYFDNVDDLQEFLSKIAKDTKWN